MTLSLSSSLSSRNRYLAIICEIKSDMGYEIQTPVAPILNLVTNKNANGIMMNNCLVSANNIDFSGFPTD